MLSNLINFGKPPASHILFVFNKRKSYKLTDTLLIIEHQTLELNEYSNELHEALINNNCKDFWKSWRSKFGSPHSTAVHVDGLITDADIGSKFALHFLKACSNPPSDRSDSLLTNYLPMRVDYTDETLSDDYLVDVELIDTIIDNLKKGRAAGIDHLTAEHLQFSVQTKLFNIMPVNGIVPDSFGTSYTIPIPKCDVLEKTLSVNVFRGIFICPIISKLLEHCILDRFSTLLASLDHHFGFKNESSCSHAIHTVKTG